MQMQLEAKLNEFDVNKIRNVNECKKSIGDLEKSVRLVNLMEDRKSFLYDHFAELKRQVDLQRHLLVLRIDKYADGKIKEIHRYNNRDYLNNKMYSTKKTKFYVPELEMDCIPGKFRSHIDNPPF